MQEEEEAVARENSVGGGRGGWVGGCTRRRRKELVNIEQSGNKEVVSAEHGKPPTLTGAEVRGRACYCCYSLLLHSSATLFIQLEHQTYGPMMLFTAF